MSTRLTSEFLAKALIRRVHDAGGSAMVLRRGDAMSGALLIIVEDRGVGARVFERGLGPTGEPALIETGPKSDSTESLDAYCARRAQRDPDLWLIELSVVDGERFAAETIISD